LWISTRLHYAQTLKNLFNIQPHSFAIFTNEEEKKIVIQILIFNEIKDEKQQNEIMDKVFNVGFKYSLENNNIMMIQMIVELHINSKNDIEVSTIKNGYDLYPAMIPLQKEKIGNKIPSSERDNDSKLNVWDVHRVLALILIFGDDFKEKYKINLEELSIVKKWRKYRKNWTSDMIQRYGFVTINLDDPDERNAIEFVHRTYAEFFVAQFIVNSIYDDHDDTSYKEVERIVNLFWIITRNYDQYYQIGIFVNNCFIHKREDRCVHEKVKQIFYQKVLEAHKFLTNPITLETHVNFIQYFLPISNIDSDVSKILWKLDEDRSLLEDLISMGLSYVNITLIAEISFGSNWHERFNKSGIQLITDEEIEGFSVKDGDDVSNRWTRRDFNTVYDYNFDIEINHLKLCDLIYKSFPTEEKLKFFENIDMIACYSRSAIQFEIIHRMKFVLDNVTFSIKLLEHFDPYSISARVLEFIYKQIDELFKNDQEALRKILFESSWEWASPLVRSFRTNDLQILELTIKFYTKHKRSWIEIQNQLINASAEYLFHPINFPLYPIYRNFIEEVFGRDTKLIADKIEKYFVGPRSNIIIFYKKYYKSNFRDFLLYVFNNNEEKVEEILSKIN